MAGGTFQDYYHDLGLSLGATNSSIRIAFHNLAKQHHPDKSGTNDTTGAFLRAREAFEKLTDGEYWSSYDRSYMFHKLQTDRPEEEGRTRTAQYEAEENARRKPSPPPVKPHRKKDEPSWKYFNGRAYMEWQKKDAAHRLRHPERNEYQFEHRTSSTTQDPTAHGMRVEMTSHPSTEQHCACHTGSWRLQASGTDYCVFCMIGHTGGSRCPGCEALACPKCMREIEALERKAFGGLSSRAQYRASGS